MRGAVGIGRLSYRRDQRQSGRAAIESVGERQREREQKEGARRHSDRAGREGPRSPRERKRENRRRGQERIERIGLVSHEGVAGERAGGERRNGKRNGEKRGTQAASFAEWRDDRRGGTTRRAVIGSRRQDRPFESGKEDGRQRKDREHIDRQLQGERRRGDHRLQRHDDDEMEEVNRVRDAAEVKACASDGATAEKALGPPEHAN